MRKSFAALCVLAAGLVPAARAQDVPVLIRNAHVVTLAAEGEIANGSILIRSGRIVEVGAHVSAPEGARVFDAQGLVATPGFMLMGNAPGATGFPRTPGHDDSVNGGDTSAGFDIQYAIDPDSVYLPELRREGSTWALATPNMQPGGKKPFGYFGGLAAVVKTGAPPSIAKARVAVALAMGTEGAAAAGGSRAGQIIALRRLFGQLKADVDGKPSIPGLAAEDLDALRAVVAGRIPLLVHARRKVDIVAALALAREFDLRIVLNGADEAWRVADDIAKAGVPVIASATYGTPSGPDGWSRTTANLARLAEAGVAVALELDDGGAIFNHPTLRYYAGVAVANGLPRETALRALTATPAAIFGLDADYGTLEPGKVADLVLWTGDPFEPATGVRAVFVDGIEQSRVSRKSLLRDRYLDVQASGE